MSRKWKRELESGAVWRAPAAPPHLQQRQEHREAPHTPATTKASSISISVPSRSRATSVLPRPASKALIHSGQSQPLHSLKHPFLYCKTGEPKQLGSEVSRVRSSSIRQWGKPLPLVQRQRAAKRGSWSRQDARVYGHISPSNTFQRGAVRDTPEKSRTAW